MALLIRLFILLSIFGATVLALLASTWLEKALPGYRAFWAALSGAAFGAALYFLISRILSLRKTSSLDLGFRVNEGIYGVWLALIAFNICLAAFSFTHKIDFTRFDFSNLGYQLLFQIRPALIEEIGFRFGLALFASIYFGRTAGIIAGSIPFGLMHLLSFASGEPVVWNYILGTTIAGAFLTLVFFRHGLLAAILSHYIWNVLASVIPRTFSFTQESLEGASTTFVVLLIMTVNMWLHLRKLEVR